MSIGFELPIGVALTNAVELREGLDGFTTAANYGELGAGGVTIDDPNGSLAIKGWQTFRVTESAATPPTVWAGFIYGRPITRLDGHDLSRKWDCDLIDGQAVLKFRVITGADGKRPAETDLQRVAWLMGSSYLAGVLADAGLVNVTDNPINFGEADYRGRYPNDVLADITGISGKQFFVYYDETEGFSLFYDLAAAPVKDAGLSISNDDDEIAPADDPPVLPPLDAVEVFRSPEDVYSGVRYTYKGVSIYRTRQETADEFGIERDGTYDTDRVGKAATAEAQAALWLGDHSAEKDTLRLEVELTPEQVNLVNAGDRLPVKFEHLPGYDPGVFTRVTQRIIRFEAPETWIAKLECSVATLHGGGGGGGGADFPWQGGCDADDFEIVASDDYSVPSDGIVTIVPTPTTGNYVVIDLGMRTPAPDEYVPDGFDELIPLFPFSETHQDFQVGRYGKRWGPSDPNPIHITAVGSTTSELRIIVTELAGVDDPDDHDTESEDLAASSADPVAGTLTPSGATFLLLGTIGFANNVSTASTNTPNGDAIELVDISQGARIPMWTGYQVEENGSGAYSMSVVHSVTTNGWGGMLTSFVCHDSPPLPGQPVPPLPPTGDIDGSNTDFVAPFPFSDGSHYFLHDGIDQSDHIATEDGETGEFTLDYAPSAGSTLRSGLQGR